MNTTVTPQEEIDRHRRAGMSNEEIVRAIHSGRVARARRYEIEQEMERWGGVEKTISAYLLGQLNEIFPSERFMLEYLAGEAEKATYRMQRIVSLMDSEGE